MADVEKLDYLAPGGAIEFFDPEVLKAEIQDSIDETNKRIDEITKGNFQIAFIDYSLPENQESMTPLTYYFVPFTQNNAFITFNQSSGVGSATVYKFEVYVKGTDGSVSHALTWYPEGNKENIAYLNQPAVFSAGISKSASKEFDDLTDNELVTKKEVQNALTDVSINDATTTEKGKVELATNAEAFDGVDTSRAITPANLDYVLKQHDFASYKVYSEEPSVFVDNNICVIVKE